MCVAQNAQCLCNLTAIVFCAEVAERSQRSHKLCGTGALHTNAILHILIAILRRKVYRIFVLATYPGRVPYVHTGKCIRRFGGIYAYCRYFIDRKW